MANPNKASSRSSKWNMEERAFFDRSYLADAHAEAMRAKYPDAVVKITARRRYNRIQREAWSEFTVSVYTLPRVEPS